MPTILTFTLSISNASLDSCNMGVSAWMTGYKLKLNHSNTEFLLIGSKAQREKFLNNLSCFISGQDTNPSASAKNVGIVFDSSLNFRKHISLTCRSFRDASLCISHDLFNFWEQSINKKWLTITFFIKIDISGVGPFLNY